MKCFIIGMLVIMSTAIRAQWEPLHGPYGGRIRDMGQNDEYIFASTADGLFRSADGRTWHPSRFVPEVHQSCGALAVKDSIVVAVSTELYLSFDHGDTWTQTNRPTGQSILDLILTNFALYALAVDGLWYSTDLGQTWQLSSFPAGEASAFSMATDGHRVVVGSTGRVFVSLPASDEWIGVSLDNPEVQALSVYVEDSLLLAIDPYREVLLRSFDGGVVWTENVDSRWSSINIYVDRLSDRLFISLDSVIMRSQDQGLTWTMSAAEGYATASSMIARDSSLFFGTFSRGVLRSDDFGEHCDSSTQGITASGVDHVAIHDQAVVAASSLDDIQAFDAASGQWGDRYNMDMPGSYFHDLLSLDGGLYLNAGPGQVSRFDDASQSWMLISESGVFGASRMYGYRDTLLILSEGFGLWHPDVPVWRAFHVFLEGDTIFPIAFAEDADYVYAGREAYVYRRSATSGSWTTVFSGDAIGELGGYQVRDLYTMGGRVFLTMVVNHDSQDYRILMSEDQGQSWDFVDADFPNLHFPWWAGLGQMLEANGHVLACGYNHSLGVVVSSLDNIRWESFNEGLPNLGVQDLAVDDAYIYAALRSNGVWRRRISDLTTTTITPATGFISFQCVPNPASGYLDVVADLPGGDDRVIYLVDVTGKVMASKAMPGSHQRIEVSHLPNGIYLVLLVGDQQLQARKILIHH